MFIQIICDNNDLFPAKRHLGPLDVTLEDLDTRIISPDAIRKAHFILYVDRCVRKILKNRAGEPGIEDGDNKDA